MPEVTKIIDRGWMLINEEGAIYCFGKSAKGVWDEVVASELMGTGITKDDLKKKGYRAKKVAICLE